MRIAVITFFCSLFIIFATMVVGIGVVVSGPLNAQEFFIEGVQSEFDDWSQRLIKIDGEYIITINGRVQTSCVNLWHVSGYCQCGFLKLNL